MKLSALRRGLCNPRMIAEALLKKSAFLFHDDKLYLTLLWWCQMGYKIDWEHPRTFCEKLQWLKLYDRKPEYTRMVDKYAVKEYVSGLIGEEHIIPTLGVWDRVEDIEWDLLPAQFVLKTTNGGGGSGVVVCKDKQGLNLAGAIKTLTQSQNQDIYTNLREWPYKNVPRRIIAEQYMEDDSGELRDYKFYCFHGVPKVMLLASNRFTDHNFNYFDMDFKPLPIVSTEGRPSDARMVRPSCFDEMKVLAAKLSQGFPHIRVDLYCCNEKVYFGELTLYDSSGYDDLNSEEWNRRFGDWITLPEKCAEDGVK